MRKDEIFPAKPTNKKAFIELLEEIPDHRIGNAVQHKLIDVFLIGLLSIICNGDTAIDGKTIRGSYHGQTKAKHVVTAFASDLQLVLGQLTTDEKSNEITIIPKLLEMFGVKGNVITIDAIGTQVEIAEKIVEKGGEYVLALKENHPNLYEDIRFFMQEDIVTQRKTDLKNAGAYAKMLEKGHGRIETRECFLTNGLSWLDGRDRWASLQGAALIRSTRETPDGHKSTSEHYFIFSERCRGTQYPTQTCSSVDEKRYFLKAQYAC